MSSLSDIMNRSTKGRSRRAGNKKMVKSRKSTRASRASARRIGAGGQPPVMKRNPGAGTLRSSAKPGKKTKRRFYVALNSPGAEMRLPAIPAIGVGWRWVSMALAGLLIFLLYQAFTSPTFRVEAAEISGLRRLTDMNVYTTLNISGEPIFTLDKATLEGTLSAQFPEFSTVDVEIGLPNTVVISVTERIPVLTWVQNGQSQLIDSQGLAFPMRIDGPNYSTPVVEASGAPPTPMQITIESFDDGSILEADAPEDEVDEIQVGATALLTQEMVDAVLTLARLAPEDTPIKYDETHGLGWKDPRGWDVFFGTARDIELKLMIYGAIVARFQVEGIQPALISVENPHAPIYRMER
jgi:cell division protein FtsQ